MSQIKWQCRWSPTLGDLESTHQEVWGTDEYTDDECPTVFMGVYGLPDFFSLWRHKGIKHILWCGSDVTNLKNNYWLEDGGGIRLDRKGICEWINKHCVRWCENEVEARALAECGIYARVQPSFLGDIDDFPLSWKPGNKVYASVSGDNFELYGWDKITELARQNPGLMFHLYGNTVVWMPKADNIVVHGRVDKERMNAEIMDMQCGLRMTEFDGMSEITVKSVLMGQWPVSLIEYPYILRPDQLSEVIHKQEPNLEGREYYRKALNNYPWNLNYDV